MTQAVEIEDSRRDVAHQFDACDDLTGVTSPDRHILVEAARHDLP